MVTAVKDSFENIEAYDQITEKIVVFGADDASINESEEGGVIAALGKAFGAWNVYI